MALFPRRPFAVFLETFAGGTKVVDNVTPEEFTDAFHDRLAQLVPMATRFLAHGRGLRPGSTLVALGGGAFFVGVLAVCPWPSRYIRGWLMRIAAAFHAPLAPETYEVADFNEAHYCAVPGCQHRVQIKAFHYLANLWLESQGRTFELICKDCATVAGFFGFIDRYCSRRLAKVFQRRLRRDLRVVGGFRCIAVYCDRCIHVPLTEGGGETRGFFQGVLEISRFPAVAVAEIDLVDPSLSRTGLACVDRELHTQARELLKYNKKSVEISARARKAVSYRVVAKAF